MPGSRRSDISLPEARGHPYREVIEAIFHIYKPGITYLEAWV